jgi:hypothetical protein
MHLNRTQSHFGGPAAYCVGNNEIETAVMNLNMSLPLDQKLVGRKNASCTWLCGSPAEAKNVCARKSGSAIRVQKGLPVFQAAKIHATDAKTTSSVS